MLLWEGFSEISEEPHVSIARSQKLVVHVAEAWCIPALQRAPFGSGLPVEEGWPKCVAWSAGGLLIQCVQMQ